MTISRFDAAKVALARLMSTALALWLTIVMTAPGAAAHEVYPAIVDMAQEGDRLVFTLQTSAESLVAGIDLDGLEDTNAAPESDRYDALRILEPAALETELTGAWPGLSDKISVTVDGLPRELTLDAVAVPEVGDVELVRTSVLTFSAPLSDGAETVEVSFDSTLGTVVLRQQGVEAPYDGYLAPGAATGPIRLAGGERSGPWQTVFRFVPAGLDQVVPLGPDHILFVLALFFLTPRIGPLAWQLSAFTLAHTISLALATLGYVSVPGSIVAPLIALSIVYVAVENVLNTSGRLTPWRTATVFGFGLLHGLGFASGLAEVGVPEAAVVPALIGYSVGVDLGQLLVIAVAYLIVVRAMRNSVVGIEDRKAALIYLAIAVIVLPALFLALRVHAPDLGDTAAPLLVAVAVLLGLSAASTAAEGQGSYDWIVSTPASILIAVTGAWWAVERAFL